MLKISQTPENETVIRLRLDGTLNTASYAELEIECRRQQQANNKTIVLDMAGVVFMNNDVAGKLSKLRNERLRLINCSPFIETLLQSVDP